MGVSALLDELLAEGHGKEAPPASPVRELRQQAEIAAEDLSCCQVTPRSRQIAELCGEMDCCLASLGRWEEESRLRVQALRQDLEQQYGFAYEEGGGATCIKDWELKDVDEPDELQQQEAYCRALSGGKVDDLPLLTRSRSASPVRSMHQVVEDPLRRADEERIAKLRAEVESLRHKEAEMQQEIMQQWLECEALEGSAPPASELSTLCREADRLLGEEGRSLCDTRAEMLEPSALGATDQVEGMEARLAEAQSGLVHMEGHLNSARSQIDSDLAELERLFNEREGDPGPARIGLA